MINRFKKSYLASLCIVILFGVYTTQSMAPKYNPKIRMPFSTCLVKAIWHTITNRQEQTWNWKQVQLLSAPKLAQEINHALEQNKQDPTQFLWGVGTSPHQFAKQNTQSTALLAIA